MSDVVATAQQGLAGKYKQYPQYKDSGVEWLGDVPSSWSTCAIWMRFSIGRGRVISNEEIHKNQGDYPVYSSQTLNDGIMGSLDTYDFDGDYITWTTDGANAGTVFTRSGKFNCTNVCGTLRAIDSAKTNLRFYTYALSVATSWFVRHDINPKLMNNVMGAIKVPVVHEAEQHIIAAFLDYETARIDRLIAQQQRLIELLKEKRQAVISHAVTKGINPDAPMKDSGVEWLGQVPKHWVVTYNKYLVQLTPKKSQITLDREQLCSFIPMEKLKQDTLILDEQRVIGDVFDGYTYFEDEDILLAKVTPCFENKNSVVARGLINGVGFGSTEIFVLRCNSQINNDFMYYRLQEGCFMDTATAAMTGAGGLKRVPSDVILNYKIALPPIEEQLAIVKALKNQLDACDKLIERAFSAIALMQERRTALISAAVTGKIDLRGWTQPAEEVAA